MEAATLSAIASSVAAMIAAYSAWNSQRSARASRDSVADSRRQRDIENDRIRLNRLEELWDSAAALDESLTSQRYGSASLIEKCRQDFRRSLVFAGFQTKLTRSLVEAKEPLPRSEMDEFWLELTSEIGTLREAIGQPTKTEPRSNISRALNHEAGRGIDKSRTID